MVVRIFLAIFLFAMYAFAVETAKDSSAVVDSTVAVQDSAGVEQVAVADTLAKDSSRHKGNSIPLPRQSAYTGYGLLVGLAAGIFNPTKECDCLGVWQGQIEYFYSDWISAGFDVRFFGGDLDTDMMLRYQRYRANVRFLFPRERWSWYVSPIIGFESTDLEDFREEWHNRDDEWWIPGAPRDTTREVEDCEKMFSLDGLSIGVDFGAGVNISRYFGLTGSVLYEYNFGGAQMLTLSPGIAFNLRQVWRWANRNLSASWVSVESGFQRYFNRSVDSWAMSVYLGTTIGF
jgi:hypothetical protein